MDFEDSRGGPSTKDYEIAMSNIYSARDQELSKAREYVRNQIRPFAIQCVHEGADWGLSDLKPTFSNFYQYVKDNAYGTENLSFVREVLNDYKPNEYWAKCKNETTPLMQEILDIYGQEKRDFEIEIQNECKKVLQLIINEKFVIQKDTNNCIMVDYLSKYVFTCNPELIKSIANNYLQKFCPKNIHRLSVKTIDLSGWTLEITK